MGKFLALAFSCVLLLPVISHAQVTDLNSLQTQLSQHDVLRGEFTQTRHLEMFSQPLSSKGHFVLSKSHGLLWQQNTPFPVHLVLTQDKLSQSFAGKAPQVVTAEQNPMAFYFSRIFLAVFQGDTRELTKEFELTLKPSESNWQLHLTPKQAPLNAVFQGIVISGNESIDALELNEVRRDRTVIEFSSQTHQPDELSDEEKEQFTF